MTEKEILKESSSFSQEIMTEMQNVSESKIDSQKFNSLIIKEEPLLKPEKYYERRGNCFFFLYTKNGYPLIIIGPHCK
jgi:hypothetical protein